MKRFFCAALAALAILCVFQTAASAKNVLILRGLFGEVAAPMQDVAAALRAKGHKVTLGSWRSPNAGTYDYVIGHSRGADVALLVHPKAKKIALDPTFLNAGCGGCTNFYNPMNKVPFIFCCGGYAVRGASNVVVRAGHVYVPTAALKQVVALVK